MKKDSKYILETPKQKYFSMFMTKKTREYNRI